MPVLKRILAIVAALVVVVAASLATDMAVSATAAPGLEQGVATRGMWVFVTAYRCLYSMLGGFVAARFAPDHKMGHAWAIGLIGLSLGLVGVILVKEPGPDWYPVAVAAQALPFAWIGGTLAVRDRPNAPAR